MTITVPGPTLLEIATFLAVANAKATYDDLLGDKESTVDSSSSAFRSSIPASLHPSTMRVLLSTPTPPLKKPRRHLLSVKVPRCGSARGRLQPGIYQGSTIYLRC